MKKIEAVICPSRVDAVRTELQRRGIQVTLTLTEVRQANGYKGSIFPETLTVEPTEGRVKMELIVGDRQAQRAMGIISRNAVTASNRIASCVSLMAVNEMLQIVPALPAID